MVQASPEKRWIITGVLLFAGLTAIYLTIDIPYLMFMKQAIEPSTDHLVNVLHLSAAGVMIVICVMYATVVILKQSDNSRPRHMYALYFIGFLVLLHFVFTIVAGVKLATRTKSRLKEDIKDYWRYRDGSIEQRYVDDVQTTLKCCGITSVGDYATMDLPPSCCSNKDCDKHKAYQRGCIGELSSSLTSQTTLPTVIVGLSFILILINLAGVIRFRFIGRHANNYDPAVYKPLNSNDIDSD